MELDGEYRGVFIDDAFTGAVVGIDHAHLSMRGQSVAVHSIAVVLAGDINPAGGNVPHRLVCTPVAVFQFDGFAALGQGQQLMTQADAENGHARLIEFADGSPGPLESIMPSGE